jgi:transcriptional antiterminator RfaH
MAGKKWYALYTRSKTEKKVFAFLDAEGIEAYLPLMVHHRQWSDRVKKTTVPLFRGYVFVHLNGNEFGQVLSVPGVIRFISFEGRAIPIPPEQIEAIRIYTREKEVDPIEGEFLNEGQLVRVNNGPMTGLIGRLIRHKGKFRLIIRIEAVGKSITLSISRSSVEAIP